MAVWDLLQGGGYGGLGPPPGSWLGWFGTSSREVAMVVWELLQGGGYGGLGPDGLPFF